jgi:hypothetical protein
MVLETTTPIKGGSVSGGFELLPGLLVQLSAQTGGLLLMLEAKPLKLGEAFPPLSEFCFDQVALQNVTVPPTPAVLPPMTKEP